MFFYGCVSVAWEVASGACPMVSPHSILLYPVLPLFYYVPFFSLHFLNVRVLSCPSYSILLYSSLLYSILFYSAILGCVMIYLSWIVIYIILDSTGKEKLVAFFGSLFNRVGLVLKCLPFGMKSSRR